MPSQRWPQSFEQPTGRSYCLKVAPLRFVPTEQLVDEGYGLYALFFAKQLREE